MQWVASDLMTWSSYYQMITPTASYRHDDDQHLIGALWWYDDHLIIILWSDDHSRVASWRCSPPPCGWPPPPPSASLTRSENRRRARIYWLLGRQGYVSSAVKQVTSDSWHLIPGTPSSKVCFTVESCKNVLKRPPSKRYPSLNSFQLVSKQTVFFAPFDIALVTPSKFSCFDFVYASNQHMFPYLGPWNCLIAK